MTAQTKRWLGWGAGVLAVLGLAYAAYRYFWADDDEAKVVEEKPDTVASAGETQAATSTESGWAVANVTSPDFGTSVIPGI